MADVFIYMYLVGAGLACGFGSVAFVAWKIVNRSPSKKARKKKAKAIV